MVATTRQDRGDRRLTMSTDDDLQRENRRRPQIEDELRKAEQEANDLIRYAPTAIYEVDFRTVRFTRVNDAMCEMSGYTREELLALSPFALLDAESQKLFHVRMVKSLAGEPIDESVEYRAIRKDGQEVYVVLQTRYLYEQGKPVSAFVIAHDVTERRRADKEREELHRALEQRATDLESANHELDAFAYSVSHDLRTPLSAIVSLSHLLRQDYAAQLTPDVERLVDLIDANAVAMDRLLLGLLTFSRLSRQPVKKELVDMRALAQQALDTLQSAWQGREIEFVFGHLPSCEADPVLLKQVWINLLSNAIKFTRNCDNTRIEVGATTNTEDSPSEDCPVYFVRDNGVGFDEAQADKLFRVFQRLHGDEEYEGTGVGLAIIERIIRRHGGRVWAHGEEDKGATFSFTLA